MILQTHLLRSLAAGMTRTFPLALAAAFALAFTGEAGAQTRDKNWTDCAQSDNDNVVIRACSAVLAGAEPDANRFVAFKNLCLAYNDKAMRERAIQSCDQAIALQPSSAEVFVLRGHVYFNTQNNDRAIQDYDQAIALGSKNATTFVQRGAAYHNKGEEVRAMEDLDQAIALDPHDSTAFFIRGAAHKKREDYPRAIEDFGAAIKLAPRFAASFFQRGILQKRVGNIAAGDADIAQAIKLDPGYRKLSAE